MKKSVILIFIVFSLVGSQAIAGNFGTVRDAKITMIRVDNDGRAMIYFDKPIGGNPPECVHNSYKNAFGIDASTEGGKAVLSMALTAKSTGSSVTAHGMGKCGIYGGNIVETWRYGVLK